jgi:hypothetical protein
MTTNVLVADLHNLQLTALQPRKWSASDQGQSRKEGWQKEQVSTVVGPLGHQPLMGGGTVLWHLSEGAKTHNT